MNSFVFGQYLPGSSLIYRMNAGSKFLLSLFFVLVTLLADDWRSNLLLFVFIVLVIWLMQIPLSIIYRETRPLIWLIFFTSGFQLLFSSGNDSILDLRIINITWSGVNNTGLMMIRFILIIEASLALTLSTSPVKLADGIKEVLIPLKRFRVPIETIALMISVSLRFIPLLITRAQLIVKAQRSRGVNFHSGSLKQRCRRILRLLIPLLFYSLERAQILSYAMVSRGYQNNVGRVNLSKGNSWQVHDFIAWEIMIGMGLVTLLCRK